MISVNLFSQTHITSKKYILNGTGYTIWWYENPKLVFEEFSNDSTVVSLEDFGAFNPLKTSVSMELSNSRNFDNTTPITAELNLYHQFFRTDKLVFPTEKINELYNKIKKRDTLFIKRSLAGGENRVYFDVNLFTSWKIKRKKSSKKLTIFGKTNGQYNLPNPKITFEKFGKDNTMIYLTDVGMYNSKEKLNVVYWFNSSIDEIGLTFEPTLTWTKSGELVMRIQDLTKFSKYMKTATYLMVQLDEVDRGTFNIKFQLNNEIKKELKKYKLKSDITNCVCFPKEVEKITKN